MRQTLRTLTARFRRDDAGTSTVEFALWAPLGILVIIGAMELGYYNVRHGMLERGLDTTVREIRLSTGFIPNHDNIRDSICEKADIIQDCESNLRLEMKVVDPRDFQGIPVDADCSNQSQEARPLRQFEHGGANQLMLLRACVMYDLLMPEWTLGKLLDPDQDGYTPMIATTAFVQEPR